LKALVYIIGPHHTHLIPKGLPGEGNVLVFDNGGAAGYGDPNPGAPNGTWNAIRDHSGEARRHFLQRHLSRPSVSIFLGATTRPAKRACAYPSGEWTIHDSCALVAREPGLRELDPSAC
jgi:hypothetical protein